VTDLQERLARSLEGRYRIERELGQGGMATVFLAEDLRHERKVALKVLKPELAAVLGADRFVVEIKTTAALQHPHILPLFDSGSADGFLFYVMPFIDGETLRDKLNRESQFGVDEAVRIACEVADALDYAHRHGVIHRDIKPENILLHDGRPMVADFGIALALSAAAGGRMTETGLSLGTPHYMSPEQATAEKEITGRSDVYSLASVLYEMLSGEPPHMGKTAQQIIMKIIAEPVKPVTELRKSVPTHVAEAVAQALEKLPADRFASAAEFAAALKGQGVLRTTIGSASRGLAPRSPWRGVALGALGATLVVGAVAAAIIMSRPEAQLLRVGVAFPENEGVFSLATRRFELSRDGRRVVYVGPDSNGTQLWVRELDALRGRPLPGTRNATAPFFSPDGQTVGFVTEAGSSLAVVGLDGGQPRIIVADSVLPWGADWADDGFIYVVHRTGRVARLRASGGALELVTALDTALAEFEHDWPQLLPGGKKLLVQSWRSSISNSRLSVIDLETGERTEIAGQGYGRYVRSGHIVYATFDGVLRAVPFDVSRGRLTGEPVVIEQNLSFDGTSGAGQFSVAETGLLLFGPGGGTQGDLVVWVDRRGGVTPVDSGWRGQFSSVTLSPDESRLALSVESGEGVQVWVKQLPRGPLTRLTFEHSNYREAWVAGGREVAYIRQMMPRNLIMRQRADGSAAADSVLSDRRGVDEVTYAPDGRTIVYRVGTGSGGSRDVLRYRFGVDTAGQAVAANPNFDEYGADISPDGRHVAYVSVESGRAEVYVRRLDDPGAGRVQVSINGGEEPRWARSGRELFFRTRRGDFLAATRAPGPEFAVARITLLFSNSGFAADAYHRVYDVARGDQRFVMVQRTRSGMSELVLVSDWRALERKALADVGSR
jgi:Tol biopolymer transport system component